MIDKQLVPQSTQYILLLPLGGTIPNIKNKVVTMPNHACYAGDATNRKGTCWPFASMGSLSKGGANPGRWAMTDRNNRFQPVSNMTTDQTSMATNHFQRAIV